MEKDKKRLQSHNKVVYIFPHTSVWEFVIGVLYLFAHPGLLDDGYFVMKPQPFREMVWRNTQKGTVYSGYSKRRIG